MQCIVLLFIHPLGQPLRAQVYLVTQYDGVFAELITAYIAPVRARLQLPITVNDLMLADGLNLPGVFYLQAIAVHKIRLYGLYGLDHVALACTDK